MLGILDRIRLHHIQANIPALLNKVIADAGTSADGRAAAQSILTDTEGQEVLAMSMMVRLNRRAAKGDANATAILNDASTVGALPSGWLQNLLQLLITDGPQILALIMAIAKLFGGP